MSTGQQKIVQVTAYNYQAADQAVAVVEGPIPEPGPKEVLVRIQLRPVNPADIFSLQGVYAGFTPKELPAVPGLEGMGVVAKCGPGATKFKEGQRVTAVTFATKSGNGTWQQYAAVPEDVLLPVPDKLSDEAAAQFLVNPVTAFGFFDELKVPQGEYLISNAAASVLGRMIIQLGKHFGVKTINLVRSAHHAEDLKKLGADEVIVTSEEDVVERVKEITGGKGAYAALECVGGDITQKLIQATRNGGHVLIYGAMQGFEFTTPIPDILFRAVVIRGFWLNVYLTNAGDRRKQVLNDVMSLLADGVIEPYGGKHFSLDEVQEAVRHTQESKRGGKCFLEG